MSYAFGGLTLANVGDKITMTSVSTNLELVLKNSASATAPVGPQTGQCWYDTSIQAMKQWDGTQWVGIGGGASVSGTAPTSPQTGDIWYDTVDGQLKTWNGTAWVASAATTPYGAVAPSSPQIGDLWYDTVAGTLKVWNGTSWTQAGAASFEDLTDVSVSAKVTLQSGIMWDATAVSGGVTGQWVPNQIYDASPTGGASDDF